MIHDVKVFDAQGNLKEIITPVFNYDPTHYGNKTERKCLECEAITTRKKFCSDACSKLVKNRKESKKRAIAKADREARPTRPCQICGKPTHNRKNCSPTCLHEARKIMTLEASQRDRVLREIKKKLELEK